MKSLRTLLLEDSPADAELLLRELRRAGYTIDSRRVETAENMREALADGPWDVVFSDYAMPSFDAVAALRILKEHDPDVPMIIVSGTIGEETAVEALKAGADDFLAKAKLARLVPVLERSLREAATRREQKRLQAQLLVSDRMVTVGALSAGIVHEINNRLTAILANLELAAQVLSKLVADPALAERKELAEANEPLEDAREASRRLRDIVRDLRILSRADEGVVGKGTPFRVHLPSSTATTPRVPASAPLEPAPSRRRGRVLVVDDEAVVAKSVQRMLREHDVEIESSGALALDRLRGGATYDVIFCDLMMPEVSGMELYEELARWRPDQAQRLIFMTGGVFVPEVSAFLDRVHNARVEKPFEGATLRALVNERVH